MAYVNEVYTYRCNRKVKLEKKPHQFVVRALPDRLRQMGWSEMEQVSSASTRITTTNYNLDAAIDACRSYAPTHHAYQLKNTGEDFLITDRVFVRFKKRPSQETLNEFQAKYSLLPKARYSAKEFLYQLSDHTAMNPVKLVVLLTEKEKLVKSAGHDLNRQIQKYQTLIPNDPAYLRQWHLHNRSNDPDFDHRASSRCEEAWALLENYGSTDVVVCVTDDGCRLDHEDFNSPNKFAAWGYFSGQTLITNTDIQAREENMYQRGADHGTSCAGVVAGEVDAQKTVGAAPNCSLLPIKWQSDGPSLFISDSKLITALDFIADKVDVMSNSWGGSPSGVWEDEVVNKTNALSQNGGRRGKGIVFLWAAGNENCPIEHSSGLDIPFTSGVRQRFDGSLVWIGVETSKEFHHNLVDLPGVMHVAALASTAQRSHYSNYGTGISLCAPTNNIHTYRRSLVEGLGITTTTGQVTGVTHSFGGTSSATPLVAGIAALVISANQHLTARETISILKSTASKELNFTGYPKTLPTSFDPDTSWDVSPVAPFDNGNFADHGFSEGTWSPWFGHGKVDALEAVREALSRRAGQEVNRFQQSSAPSLAIPDMDADGVTDIINCPVDGTLSTIRVSVDIAHTYIGDLVLVLTAPSGRNTLLQNRNGGSSNNLVKTFDFANTAFLNSLIGESIQGDWKLTVADRAPIDTGILNNWNLDIQISAVREVVVQENPGVAIPDNTASGIERTLRVNNSGRINSLEIAIDITHTFIGDLTVELASPRSERFMLSNRRGGHNDNLIRVYSMADTPSLNSLKRKSIRGDWKLKIIDHARIDVGKLNHWRLTFQLQ